VKLEAVFFVTASGSPLGLTQFLPNRYVGLAARSRRRPLTTFRCQLLRNVEAVRQQEAQVSQWIAVPILRHYTSLTDPESLSSRYNIQELPRQLEDSVPLQ
jgi:hypothetical protein